MITSSRLVLFIVCLSFYLGSCSKSTDSQKPDTDTTATSNPQDTLKLLNGWWEPENFKDQAPLYFNTQEQFFYNDSLQMKAPFPGFWSLKNGIITCSKSIGGEGVIQFKIKQVSADRLVLSTIGIGLDQPFKKSAKPAITSPPMLSIAGTGIDGNTGDGGLATNAQISGPGDIVTDSEGNVYFVSGKRTIRKISKETGVISTYVATTSDDIRNLAIDKNNDVYFSDWLKIYKISAQTKKISVVAGGGPTYREDTLATKSSLEPVSFDIDVNGDIVIIDVSGYKRIYRIRKVYAATKKISSFVGLPSDSKNICIDASGNIYFQTGAVVNKMLNKQKAYAAIAGKNYTSSSAYKSSGDGGPAKNATFKSIGGLTLSPQGDVFITEVDPYVCTVRKIDASTGIVTKVAGNGSSGKTVNGIHATAYPLFKPFCINTDQTGKYLYIGDGSHRIQKVEIF